MDKNVENKTEQNAQQQPQPLKDITLKVQGELRNYQVEHLSDDAKNKIGVVIKDEQQVLPLIQRLFTLAALGQQVEAEAMADSLPNKYEVVKQPEAEEEAPVIEQPNGKPVSK